MYHIIHVDTERTWRGGEAQVFHLATRLDPTRFRSVVAAPEKSALVDRARAAGVRWMPLGGTGEFSPSAVWNLLRGIRRFDADIIHVHASHGLIPAAAAAALSRRPVKIVYSRRTDFPFRTSLFNLSRLKYLKGADIILAVSRAIRDILVESGIPDEHVIVIRSGIDVQAFKPGEGREKIRAELGIDPGTYVIGSVAALEPHKDPMCFLDAARIILAQRSDVVFIWVGSGRLMNELQSKVRDAGIEKRFRLLGFRTDVPDLLAAMDVFSLCSISEGLGTSLLDAMAMELPVVANRVGGIPEAVEDGVTGVLIPLSSPEKHAEVILSLLQNPDLMRQMGKAGRKRVEDLYDIRRTVKETEQVYCNLMGRMK